MVRSALWTLPNSGESVSSVETYKHFCNIYILLCYLSMICLFLVDNEPYETQNVDDNHSVEIQAHPDSMFFFHLRGQFTSTSTYFPLP